MSYCRWSTDDFKCDLYVYEASDGIYVHIAGSRVDLPDDAYPPDIPEYPEGYENATPDERQAHLLAWMDRFIAVSKLVTGAPRKSLDGPLDGQTFSFSNHNEAADWIENELAPLGIYNFPDNLTASLREDMVHDV